LQKLVLARTYGWPPDVVDRQDPVILELMLTAEDAITHAQKAETSRQTLGVPGPVSGIRDVGGLKSMLRGYHPG